MQKHYLFFGLILWSHFLAAQSSKWVNYANDYIVWDILPTDEFLWVSTQGGLERIDRKTGQRKIFQPWNSGLRGTDVTAVNIAPDGKIWISSNQGGLFRFDGAEAWEQFYDVGPGTHLSQIKSLQITPEGKLWFVSNINDNCSGCTKIYHYDGVHFSEHQDALSLVLGNYNIRTLRLDQAGKLWAAAGPKIASYDGSIATDAAIPLVNNERIMDMAFDRNNTLWVSTDEYVSGTWDNIYRIRYFDGNTWSMLEESTLGGEIFQTIKMFKAATGDFYIAFNPENGAASTFAKFDGISWAYTKLAELPNLPTTPDSDLNAVDSQGHLWFSGYNGPHTPIVYEFDGQTWKSHVTEIFPLGDNYVSDVAFDCDNNAFFGAFNALTRFDGVSWKDYTREEMSIIGDYFSIWSLTYDTARCNLWIAFEDENGFAKFDGNSFTKYSTPDEYGTRQIAIAKDGTVWVASSNAGLGKFDGNTWTWYNEQNSPLSDHINGVAIDNAQNVWVATTYEDAIMRWDGNSWIKFDQFNSPVSGYSNWVFVDHAGMIWTSNQDGLLRFDGVEWKAFSVPGTLSQGIYSITQDHEHNFWLTNRYGTHRWDGSNFESFNFIDHPISSWFVGQVRIDPFGNKWLAHNGVAGVTVFNEKGISNQIINPTAGVRGTVFFDANQDGQQGQVSAEPGIPNEKVYLQPNNNTIFTNYDGNYTLFPPPGNYQLSYTGSEDYTPTSAQSLPLNMGTTELNGFNYGAWAENPEDSISLDMTVGNMRCGGEVNVWLSLVGYGLLEASGDITLLFDPALTFLHATPEPDLIQGNLLTWHYSGLSLYELQQINVVFQVPGVDSVGQTLSLQSDANVLDAGVVTASAEKDERGVIRCSFDPNDKSSTSVGPSLDHYSLLNDALDFTIRFQNSGNDTAFIVVLRDTLDSSLDFSTLQIVASSHPVRTTMSSNGVLTFVFDKINLLWESIDYAGSQGFVKYRIAPKVSLPDPTIINNTAHIFFDFNPAIVTNTTTNTLVESLPTIATGEPANKLGKAVKVYPNPNLGDFLVEWTDNTPAQTWQITIIDMLGRTCFHASFDQKTAQIHDLSPGFFFVYFEKEGKVECRKLVVTKH